MSVQFSKHAVIF